MRQFRSLFAKISTGHRSFRVSWNFLNVGDLAFRITITRIIENSMSTTLYPSLAVGAVVMTIAGISAYSDPLPPDATYRPLPTLPLSEVMSRDEAMKPAVMDRQHRLLGRRYDLADQPIEGI